MQHEGDKAVIANLRKVVKQIE